MSGIIDISVIIPAFQAEATLTAALQSCRTQTLSTIEVIIVDDASPRSLGDMVTTATEGDPRFHFHRLRRNQGPAGARNAGMTHARGTFIAVLDADDMMAPGRLEHLHQLAVQTGADIVADNLISLSEHPDGWTGAAFLALDPEGPPREVRLADLMESGHRGVFTQSLGYLKPVFRRAFLDRHSLSYETGLRNSEDYVFLAEALVRNAKLVLSPRPLYYYRRHAASLSHRIHPVDAQRAADAEHAFRSRHRGHLSARELAASRRRQVAMRDMARFETLIMHVRSRAVLNLFWTLLRYPESCVAHLRRIAGILARRLR